MSYMTNIVLVAALCALCLSALTCLLSLLFHRRIKRDLETIQALQDNLSKTSQLIKALTSGAKGVGDRIVDLELQIQANSKRLNLVEKRDLTISSYDHAAKMVEMGANVNDVMDSCGLSRAEADLVVLVNQSGSKADDPIDKCL